MNWLRQKGLLSLIEFQLTIILFEWRSGVVRAMKRYGGNGTRTIAYGEELFEYIYEYWNEISHFWISKAV